MHDFLDQRVTLQETCDPEAVSHVLSHPHRQRSQAALHEVAVERRWHTAGRWKEENESEGEMIRFERDFSFMQYFKC